MGIGIVSDHDLALVRDMGSNTGDELQIIHPLLRLAILLIKAEVLQGEKRPDHVLPDFLGFSPGLGPDLGMDVEARVPLLVHFFHKLRVYELLH